MSSFAFIVVYLSILSIPGFALTRLLAIRTKTIVSAVALSYMNFAVIFILSNHFEISATAHLRLLISSVAAAAIYLAIKLRSLALPSMNQITPVIYIGVLSAMYQVLFGAFTEVPADIYTHLERYQYAKQNLQQGSLGSPQSWPQLFQQSTGVFYYLLALVGSITKISATELIEVIDYVNRTLLLAAFYFFTLSVFKNHNQRSQVAYISTIFIFLHLGISVFAFVRYYTLAPTMLNMLIYMFGVLVAHEIIRKGVFSAKRYSILIIAIGCAAAIHVQEAMFIIVISVAMAIVSALLQAIVPHKNTDLGTRFSQSHIIGCAGIAVFMLAYLYSQLNFPRAPNAHWRLWDFGQGPGFIPQLTILNLKLQFSQVVTIWGALVYVLFVLNIKRYRHNIFILAAMSSPALTILNPFFIDLFLRHYNSTALWRFCFLIPIQIVAADLFLHYLNLAKRSKPLARITSSLIAALLIVLLIPYKNTWQGIHYSRLPTIKASNTKVSASYYHDLTDYLATIPQKKLIITDPMTGYMISALTKHHSQRNKFFRDHNYIRFSYENYDHDPFKKHSGLLLVVNKRQKHKSEVGLLSNHWREKEWIETDYYYPEALLSHISAKPERFTQLWSHNGISVYQIH